MNPIDLCKEIAAPLGSFNYYALKSIPKNKYNAVISVLALCEELNKALIASSDFNLVQIKLNWWRADIIKIPRGLAEHPINIAIQEELKLNPDVIDINDLDEIVDGYLQILASPIFATFEDYVVSVMRTTGLREIVIFKILYPNSEIDAELIYKFALVLEISYYLQNLRPFISKGLMFIPEDELNQDNLKLEDFQKFSTTDEIKKLLELFAEKAFLSYENAINESKAIDQYNFIKIRSKLAFHLLTAIKKNKYRVLEKSIVLTPLKIWWEYIKG